MTESRLTLPMPRLGETMEQGTIANWLVEPGASFARGDALLELDTDKTLVEYPALGSGTLLETLVSPGDIVDVGAPIAVIETSDMWEGIAALPAPEPGAAEPPAPAAAVASEAGRETVRRRATPLARRLAETAGLAIDAIAGTGRRGRIEARDVSEALATDGTGAHRAARTDADTSARSILLVHGFGGDGSAWAALVSSLQRGGHRVSAPDMPGHGENDLPANGVPDLVDWLAGTLRKQPGPVHLVGHSLGAHVAAEAAAALPGAVSRLTLIAPAGCGHAINGSFVSGMANVRSAGELSHLLRLLGPKAAGLSSDAMDAMAARLADGRLAALAASFVRGDTQCIDTIGPAARVAEHVPVDALFGLADTVVPKEHVFNMPPQVRVHVLRTGHMPQWDAPAAVERIILAGS